ncbi:Acetylspermidine deacetylase [Methylophaga thiooxydans]|uniref:Acetylspermidine deacetylase n=1 Tax=Methylophaga thiooxydans TaxID=392484 RepID=A0A0A0BJ77_9GAMM|nr:histone deacetylase [Methylophaga thiooxydans]KGM07154.1 Acetylspermidine deacetylase [Methylophaga thiooxydans]
MKRRHFVLASLGLLSLTKQVLSSVQTLQTAVVLDDGFSAHQISASHPESPARYEALEHVLQESGWLKHLHTIKPWSSEDTEPWLTSVHSQQHITSIQQQSDDTYHNVLLATGGCLAAVDAVMSGQVRNAFCASRPPGHHALNTGREEGFCYFNHIAVAARYAQQKHAVSRVLIIDWDYHHGNGTEWAFYEDPSVLFFSTHDQFAYPGTGSPSRQGTGAGMGYNINVHLECGSNEADVIDAFEKKLRPAVEKFKPEFILVSAGFDSRVDDLLGCFTISDGGFAQLTQWVMQLAEDYCDGRLVSILEGGYSLQGNAQAARAHLLALSGKSDS